MSLEKDYLKDPFTSIESDYLTTKGGLILYDR